MNASNPVVEEWISAASEDFDFKDWQTARATEDGRPYDTLFECYLNVI